MVSSSGPDGSLDPHGESTEAAVALVLGCPWTPDVVGAGCLSSPRSRLIEGPSFITRCGRQA